MSIVTRVLGRLLLGPEEADDRARAVDKARLGFVLVASAGGDSLVTYSPLVRLIGGDWGRQPRWSGCGRWYSRGRARFRSRRCGRHSQARDARVEALRRGKVKVLDYRMLDAALDPRRLPRGVSPRAGFRVEREWRRLDCVNHGGSSLSPGPDVDNTNFIFRQHSRLAPSVEVKGGMCKHVKVKAGSGAFKDGRREVAVRTKFTKVPTPVSTLPPAAPVSRYLYSLFLSPPFSNWRGRHLGWSLVSSSS